MNDESSLEFVDTDVMVYAHDKSAGRTHQLATELVQRLWDSGRGCLSVQVLQEFYVTVTQKTGKPLDPEEAAQVVRDLALWRIFAPSAANVLAEIDPHPKVNVSFWDAMILWSASQLGCGIVLSEDLNPGQTYDDVRVANPFQPPVNPD